MAYKVAPCSSVAAAFYRSNDRVNVYVQLAGKQNSGVLFGQRQVSCVQEPGVHSPRHEHRCRILDQGRRQLQLAVGTIRPNMRDYLPFPPSLSLPTPQLSQ